MSIIRASASKAVAGLFCALLLCACSSDQSGKLASSGKRYLEQGDAKSAIVELKAALQQKPEMAEARFLLGQAYLKTDDVLAAEKELVKALELGYNRGEINPSLARVGVAKGEFKEVLRDYANAETASPRGAAELHTALGEAHFALGELDAASEEYSKAETADPKYSWSYLSAARLAVRRGDMARAMNKAEKGIEVAPNEPDGWLVKGSVLEADRRREDAIQAYRKAIANKPDFAPAHAALTSSLIASSKLDEAAAEMVQLKSLAPRSPQTLYLDAVLNLHQKNLDAARDAIQEYQKFVPDDVSAAMLAAQIHFQMRSYIQAEANLLTVLRQAPDNETARRMLIASYLATGDAPRALEAIQPMLKKIGRDPAMLNAAGQIYLRSGQPTVAAEYFKQASLVDPAGVAQRTGLAMSHLAQGELSLGTMELEGVASKDSGTRANVTLITLALKQRDYDKALAAIDALEKKEPGKPLASDLRGLALLGKNDRDGARKSFERALTIDPAFVPALLNLVRIDYAEKKLDNAQRRLEAFIKANPNSSKALLALAEVRNQLKAPPDEVVGLINRAVAAQPEDLEARLALINYYLVHADPKRAVVVALETTAPMRDRPEVIDALARAQAAAGDANQAMQTYNRLAQALPNSPLPLLRIAELQHASNDNEAAAQSLERALKVDPRVVEAQRALVGLRVGSKRWKDAVAIAHTVQQQRPKEDIGYLLEGDVYATQQAWPQAIEAYRAAVKQSGTTTSAMKLHTGLITAGRAAEANKFVESWLREHPDDVTFRLYYAENASLRGDAATAVEQYRALLRSQPDNAVLLNNLAWAAAKVKDPKAVEYAEKANQLSPDQPRILDTLGTLLADKGDSGRAVQMLRRAVQIAPSDAGIRLNFARVLLQSGDKAGARRELEELAKLGDRFPQQAQVTELLKTL